MINPTRAEIMADTTGRYFTFGTGTPLANYYVRIEGDTEGARRAMYRLFGHQWAFDYSPPSFAHQPGAYGLRWLDVPERLIETAPDVAVTA